MSQRHKAWKKTKEFHFTNHTSRLSDAAMNFRRHEMKKYRRARRRLDRAIVEEERENMSGGSMNYIYRAELGEFLECVEEGYLADCVDFLEEAKAPEAFMQLFRDKVEYLTECIDFLKKFQEEFNGVLQACEWTASGDWSLDRVREEATKHWVAQSYTHVDYIDERNVPQGNAYRLFRGSALAERAQIVDPGDRLKLITPDEVEHNYVISRVDLIAGSSAGRTYEVLLKEYTP